MGFGGFICKCLQSIFKGFIVIAPIGELVNEFLLCIYLHRGIQQLVRLFRGPSPSGGGFISGPDEV
jgi:hypothetical protein